MKPVNIAYILTLVIALSLSSGCHKRLDKTTPIPGHGMTPVGGDTPIGLRNGDGTGRPIDTAPPITGDTTGRPTTSQNVPPVPEQGYPASNEDRSGWPANAEIFKDQTVYFDFDKDIVKATEIPKLEEVARRMKTEFSGPNKALRIEGHCDERGTEEYNRALGDRRATAVREKLVQLGLEANSINTITFGEEHPVDTAHNEAAYKKNRRGAILLLTRPGTN